MRAAALIVALVAAVSPASAWTLSHRSSELDAHPRIDAVVDSEAQITGADGQPHFARLGVICQQKTMTAYINWPDALDFARRDVFLRYKFAGGETQSATWEAYSIQSAIPPWREGKDWAQRLLNGGRFVVQMPDHHGGQEAAFDLQNTTEVLAAFRAAGCV